MERPLADDVARPARAYLAALVPPSEVSDAWHELLDDVAYWGDRDRLAVLRLAHQVVCQHERVTPEAAALALVESGVDDPVEVAHVLDADADDARDWVAHATATHEGDVAPPPTAPTTPPEPSPATEPSDPPEPSDATEPSREEAPTPTRVVPEPSDATEPSSTGEGEDGGGGPGDGPLRIGFEDDAPLPYATRGEDEGPRVTTRGIVIAALVLWVVVVVLWTALR